MMKSRSKTRALACVAIVSAVVAAACTSSPAQPSAAVSTPTAVTPANGAQLNFSGQPVVLVVTNATLTSGSGSVTYTFEVATDSGFSAASIVQTKSGIAAGPSGQTSATLDTLPGGKDYFWRASAHVGSVAGTFTPVAKFTLGSLVALSAPTPVTPLSGASVGTRPVLTVLNSARQGQTGNLTYTFEIADNAGFSPLAATGSVSEGASQTSFTPGSDLGSKTYFWRAAAIDVSNGVTSPASAVQTFTAVNQGQASVLAQQQGVTLWPGAFPPGAVGKASMGPGWQVGNRTSFDGVTFLSPPIDALRLFDLLDRGFDPDAAIGWMKGNGYPTVAVWYAEPKAIGLPYQYIALIAGQWELVVRAGA